MKKDALKMLLILLVAWLFMFYARKLFAATVAERLADGIPTGSSAITPANGSLWIGNGTNFIPFPIGSNGQVLSVDTAATNKLRYIAASGSGTVTSIATNSGLTGGTITTTGTIGIATGGITNTMVSASAAIDGTKIAPDFGTQLITTKPADGAIGFSLTNDTTSIVRAMRAEGGAGEIDVAAANGTFSINILGSSGTITATTFQGALSGNASTATALTSTLNVAGGGSGATTLTGILKGNGTSAFTAVTAPSGTIVGTSDTQILTTKTIQLATNASDTTWNGISYSGTAGENLVIGDLTYIKSDGKMWKAKAESTSTMECTMVSTGTISSNASGIFFLHGVFRNDAWNWTVGGKLYVSAGTAGLITQTKPATTGNQVQIVGYALSADEIYFNPSSTYVEVP